jgi:hypothetical protein
MVFNDYKDMVNKYLESDSEETFGNFSPAHASFIITKFLESAQSSVEIFSGNLNDAFYDSISIPALLRQTAGRLKYFGGKIRIITVDDEADIKKISALVDRINEDFPGTIEYAPAIYNGDKPLNHFLVVDGKRYRVEAPHDKFAGIPKYVHAEVCCNGRKRCGELQEYFNSIWNALQSE